MGVITLFGAEPPLGTRILLDDQAYELTAVEPYTRTTDGRPSRLLTWETACPVEGCGQPFNAMSGLSITSLQRRCGEHRNMTKPVKGRRGRKMRIKVELP